MGTLDQNDAFLMYQVDYPTVQRGALLRQEDRCVCPQGDEAANCRIRV